MTLATRDAFDSMMREFAESYRDKRPESRILNERATAVMPGGDTRTITHYAPFPFYVQQADGAIITDVDGNEYLDLLNNYTMLVHGHRFRPVVEALKEQVETAMAVAAPSEPAIRLAELLCSRFPSVERLRFTVSGTEAAMFAVRLARAYTGRNDIAKFEGGYHGSSDWLEVSIQPDLDAAGDPHAPSAVWEIPMPGGDSSPVAVLPYDDIEALEARLDERGSQLACVVIEPMMGVGGMLPGTPELFSTLRRAAHRHGFLVVCDEVMTVRLAEGGGQSYFGLDPDLTIFGKSIGGTLPAGGFGGRRDVMDLLDPLRDGGPLLSHSGTNNANPLAMTAGRVTLEHLDMAAIDRVNALGDRLAEGIQSAFRRASVTGCVTGAGSMRNVHLTDGPVTSYRQTRRYDRRRLQLLHMALLLSGIVIAPRGLLNLSTAVTESDVARATQAFHDALGLIRPFLNNHG
jgi:glutamate-1-semialdehyde 2,1-aminomutase